MNKILKALTDAARSLVHPIILGVLLVPMAIALVVWVGVGWLFWDTWASAIQTFVLNETPASWTAKWDLGWLPIALAVIGVVIILAPLVIVTALLIATLFAMPVLLDHVTRTAFPTLERRHGGTVPGSIWNAFAAMGVFLFLWILTLPLWLLGPFAVVVPLLLSAHLNQRLFRYDALSEHASAQEMKRIFDESRGRLFLLGLITGGLYFIPPFNLIGPVYAALAFIHLCLGELQELRSGERAIKRAGAFERSG